MRRLAILAFSSIALLACGGSVAVHENGGQGGSTGGTTGSSGGFGGSTGGFGGLGGLGGLGGSGGMCARTEDAFAYTLTPTGGKSIDCNAAQPGESQKAHLDGVVTAATTTSLTIETCPPNAVCDASTIYQLTIQSPGFAMSVPTGVFIQIDVQVDYPWGCSNTILARNLPVWEGQPSPGGDVPALFFEGSDGSPTPLDGTPFTLTSTALGCDGSSTGCGVADDYRFDVGGTTLVPVYQGQTAIFSAPESNFTTDLMFRNLRSYETGWCDDYWNWAWWVTPAPLPG